MSEHLEGVLSETLLDKLASDLGIDPKVMREHPFFRVMKGMVLLTYPLKSYPNMPTFNKLDETETDPTQATWYPILNIYGAGALYSLSVMTNDAATVLKRALRITLDNMINSQYNSADEAGSDQWYYDGLTLTKTNPGLMYIPFASRCLVEMRTDTALVAGKYLQILGKYGEIET
ncbi:unnamed protein product [marine sediment metagenome]|uniref:Uncharacterized protein n=1 Tax=marine sediment metagenome TaxID=412755 RepID=X1KLA8_9ZZZZ